jgi:acid phosphatase family membrane protein YuiD
VEALLTNRILTGCAIAWLIAQISKVVVALIFERRIVLGRLVSAGGMPSAHSAIVVALATGIGIQEGLHSAAFALASIFAMVVMYDAAGVRRAVSVQARILNRMLEEMIEAQHFNEERLRELIGHTPFEVFVGGLLGVVTAISWM